MELDFSKLNKLGLLDFEDIEEATETAPEATETEPEGEVPTLDFKAIETASTAPEGQELAFIKLTREQEDRARLQEAYRDYQSNIKNAGELRSQILKGARAGEAPTALLLKACKCISSMTGESLFSEQVEKDLKALYGEVFLEPAPLEWELDEVKERLDRLQQALQRETKTEDRQRIATAAMMVPMVTKGIRLPYVVLHLSDSAPKMGSINTASTLSIDIIAPEAV